MIFSPSTCIYIISSLFPRASNSFWRFGMHSFWIIKFAVITVCPYMKIKSSWDFLSNSYQPLAKKSSDRAATMRFPVLTRCLPAPVSYITYIHCMHFPGFFRVCLFGITYPVGTSFLNFLSWDKFISTIKNTRQTRGNLQDHATT